jgi:spore germination protein GerM
MFGRLPDGAYEGSAGDKVAIYKSDIGFVYVEIRSLGDELLKVLESFALNAGEKSSVMPEGINVKVYYFNDSIRKNNNCDEVLPMISMVFDTKNLAEASLRILLDGPSSADIENGYVSTIPSGTWLNSIKIEDGVAYADFSKELSGAAGSCRIFGIKTQIEKTLLQFPTIKSVKISVDGKAEGILEP